MRTLLLCYSYFLLSNVYALNYSLSDLAILAREKNVEEFLAHVNDIRPSERLDTWKMMYRDIVLEFIDRKLKSEDYSKQTFDEIEKHAGHYSLKDMPLIDLKRAKYALAFFQHCYLELKDVSQVNACDRRLITYWENSQKNAEYALPIVALLETYKLSKLNRWNFYQIAVKDKASPVYCDKIQVQKAIIAKLTEESFKESFKELYHNDFSKLLAKFIPTACLQKLLPTLKDAIFSNHINGVEREIAYLLLNASGTTLSTEEENLFALYFLLNGPVVGNVMNLSWNKIEALSEHYNERQKLLAYIKSRGKFPSNNALNDPGTSRNQAIINLLKRSFPEYLQEVSKK